MQILVTAKQAKLDQLQTKCAQQDDKQAVLTAELENANDQLVSLESSFALTERSRRTVFQALLGSRKKRYQPQ